MRTRSRPDAAPRRTAASRLVAGAALLLAVAVLAGCQQVAASDSGSAAGTQPAALVEPATDGGPSRVTLTPRAERELGLQRGVVTVAGDGTLAIPFGAVVYDADGGSWAFVPVDEHVYQRSPITVGRLVGDQATLLSGLRAGAEVVTVGAAFLVGAEEEISGGE